MRKIIILTILFFSSNLMAWVSVGSSPGFGTCTYTDIQSAIDSNELEIRVLNNQDFVENLTIDRGLRIKGGYTSCLSAHLNIVGENNTVIKGSNIVGAPVIKIDSGNGLLIKLYSLTLQDAIDTPFVNGGRGIEIDGASAFLELNDSLVTNNTAEDGAGIYLGGTRSVHVHLNNSIVSGNTSSNKGGGIYVGNPENVTVILEDSSIVGNTATMDGGGIYCSNSNTNINIRNESVIAENEATNGGGLYATLGCHVTIDSGYIVGEQQPFGIVNNAASGSGGGIYADLSAEIHMYGNRYNNGALGSSNRPVTLANNNATFGGAIYAHRSALISIEDGLITNNIALIHGGAFYIADSAQLKVTRSQYSECWSSDGHCSIISGNKANSRGGGIYAKLTAQVEINRSRIFSNRADIGTFAYVTNNGTKLKLNNNYIYLNGNNGIDYDDYYVLGVVGDAELEINHTTIVDNDILDVSAIFFLGSSSVLHSKLSLHNSIVHNDENVLRYQTNTPDPDDFLITCTVVNETNTVSGIGVDVFDPEFIDRNSHDYHLSPRSNAIDYCNPLDSDLTPLLQDFDGEPRPWDDNQTVDFLGIADAGADESYLNDVIFKHGFE